MTLAFGQMVLLPAAYVLGIVPALITASLDHALRNARYRVFGLRCSHTSRVHAVLTALFMGFLSSWYVLFVGSVWIVAGAICSWIAGPNSKYE